MHTASMSRMQWFRDQFLNENLAHPRAILDVGSYDVNGCYRGLFESAEFAYTGLDMEPGPNVDIAVNTPYRWAEVPTDSFDVVISGQCLEHSEFFWETLREMTRVLREGGLMCLIVPNGFAEHRYPVDCYRFFTDGMVAMARYVQLEVLHAHTNKGPSTEDRIWFSNDHADSMLIAQKPYSGPAQIVDLSSYNATPPNHDELKAPLVDAPHPPQNTPKSAWAKALFALAVRLQVFARKR